MEQGLGDVGRIGDRGGQHVDEGQLDAAHHEIHERLLDRRRDAERLRRSEAFLRQGQRISRIGSVGADFLTGEHYWSEETYRVLEIDRQTVPSFEAYLERVHPGDRKVVLAALERIKALEPEIEFEHRLLLPTGRTKHVRVLSDATGPHASSLGATGVIMDVTEAKLAEDEVHRAQAELTRITRIAMVAELTASIAHEINQPLSGILTNCEGSLRWLNRPEPDMKEAVEAIERAVVGARRVSDVVRQLRVLFTRKEPQPAELDLSELVKDTLPLLRTRMSSRHVISLDLDQELPAVFADPVQIQQVVINLLTNAIQAATSDPSREHRLWIKTARAGEAGISFAVSDDGLGIEESHLPRLFDPFFTTKAEGMGMGLSICRSIIESHGGSMFARNRPEGGAIIGFNLPTKPAKDVGSS
jgi:C4-dicarboxylate-specific signal transduction histidine kinase